MLINPGGLFVIIHKGVWNFKNKKILTNDEIFTDLCDVTNLESISRVIISYCKKLTNCEAVALRLKKNNDFPYYSSNGFSKPFTRNDNSLLSPSIDDVDTESVKEIYQFACICGKVVSGNIDLKLPFFTKNGTFHTGSISKTIQFFQTDYGNKEASNYYRDYCCRAGYESVMLIPIKIRAQIIGLMQFNDSKRNFFNKREIEHFEQIINQMSIFINLNLAYENIHTFDQKSQKKIISICSQCKKIRNEKGSWKNVEEFLEKNINAEFSHGLCPSCFKETLKQMKSVP